MRHAAKARLRPLSFSLRLNGKKTPRQRASIPRMGQTRHRLPGRGYTGSPDVKDLSPNRRQSRRSSRSAIAGVILAIPELFAAALIWRWYLH